MNAGDRSTRASVKGTSTAPPSSIRLGSEVSSLKEGSNPGRLLTLRAMLVSFKDAQELLEKSLGSYLAQ